MSEFDPDRVKSVLVVSSTAIGDALFALPGIAALRNLLPGASVDFLLRDKVAPLFRGFPNVNEIIIYRGRYKNAISLVRRLKNKNYDLCIVFHDSDPCPVETAFASGIPFIFRIGQKDDKTYHLLSARVPYDKNKHAIDQRLEVLRRVFGKELDSPEDLRMALPVEDKRLNHFKKRLHEKLGQDGSIHGGRRFLVGFQFGASGFYKEWPEGNFIELGARLSERPDYCDIILIGGPSDKARGEKIKKDIKDRCHSANVLNLAGKIPLEELPAAIKTLDILVTNDTGPLHVAIAVETRTVSLFVPSNVQGTGPIQDLHLHKVICKPKPCDPCTEKYCKRPDCMNLITVDEVESAVKDSLSMAR